MAEDNKLGRKITTLREAHHLTCQDLADRCGCDVTVIEAGGRRGAAVPGAADQAHPRPRRAPAPSWMTTRPRPAYISTDQMEEVERVKSLQTAKDAGDLSYFSLAAGRPSVIWAVHHHREPHRRGHAQAGFP
ncbi:MAG: hypothetical protein ACLUYK_01395 [Eggerthella lenta]